MQEKNILVITQWGYEEGLIQSYTLPYLKIIHTISPEVSIFLVTQEKTQLYKDGPKLKRIEEYLSGYNIILLPEKYYKAGFVKYLFSVSRLFKHLGFIFKNKIGIIHSFCTPAGSYAYILAKLTNRQLIVDSYEPHSEYMRESGAWSEKSFKYRFLTSMEKKQAVAARHLIATTPGMLAYTKKRFNIQLKNEYVKPACVDLEKFNYKEKEAVSIRKQMGLEKKIVGVYAGKFGDFYLKDEIFDLLKEAFFYWEGRLHIIFLSDLKENDLQNFCNSHQLNRKNFTLLNVQHELMPDYLSVADFAISPYKPTPSKKYCTPIKNGEYWAVGLPVIITKGISVDSDLIEENDIGYVLKSLTKEEYMNSIKKIDQLLNIDKETLRKKIRQVAIEKRSFSIAERIYRDIYS